jgi:hypothetical protein
MIFVPERMLKKETYRTHGIRALSHFRLHSLRFIRVYDTQQIVDGKAGRRHVESYTFPFLARFSLS